MKKAIMFVLLMFAGMQVSAGDGWPGNIPNWQTRHTVSCTMEQGNGVLNASFTEGQLDYAQAGSLYASMALAYRNWYKDLAELIQGNEGLDFDMRLLPTPESPITQLLEIEADMHDR